MTTLTKLNREQAKEYLKNKSTGTILIGEPGIGKTTLVRTSRMISASLLAMEFQVHGLDAIKGLINPMIEYESRTVTIDDLGIEEDVKHFGNGLDPIAYVVQRIYDMNQAMPDNPVKLVMTTNLTKSELQKRYGVRVQERLWEMCDRVKLEDTNLRKIPTV
jgi:DNA replication protein DnaC